MNIPFQHKPGTEEVAKVSDRNALSFNKISRSYFQLIILNMISIYPDDLKLNLRLMIFFKIS